MLRNINTQLLLILVTSVLVVVMCMCVSICVVLWLYRLKNNSPEFFVSFYSESLESNPDGWACPANDFSH